jgi:hypothetical protein
MSSALQPLKFTTAPVADANPVLLRRKEIITRLEQQKRLAADPNYVRTIKTRTGEKQQKVIPMWKLMSDGSYALYVRNGFNPIEWAPGKNAISVPSLDALPTVIDIIIDAVRKGELDEKLKSAKKASPAKKK